MNEIVASWGSFKALYGNTDPTKVAKEIYSIGNNIKPEQLVDFAKKNKKSELHKCFTWEDSVAAERWRIYEARQIFCHLKIQIQEPEKQEPRQLRISYKTDGTEGYKPTTLILKDPDEYDKLLSRVKRELKQYSDKYRYISEYSEVWKTIDEL